MKKQRRRKAKRYDGHESSAFYGTQPEYHTKNYSPHGSSENHLYNKWVFYASGGHNGHRPAWEDVVLARIDQGRDHKLERARREQKWRDIYAQYIRSERKRSREAAALRTESAELRRRASDAATELSARHRSRASKPGARSWHAPRDSEGNPEGLERKGEA